MNGGQAAFDEQANAVLREYRKALVMGAAELAHNIRTANPDLEVSLRAISQQERANAQRVIS